MNALWRSAWSRSSGIPIPRRLFHATLTWQRTTCIFQWSLEREFIYFAGKLVYLIVLPSHQLAINKAKKYSVSNKMYDYGYMYYRIPGYEVTSVRNWQLALFVIGGLICKISSDPKNMIHVFIHVVNAHKMFLVHIRPFRCTHSRIHH